MKFCVPRKSQEREAYTRINKYSIPLNKSELRRADLPGDFQRLSETLTEHSFFDECTLFTPNDRRRSLDMEYISELLAIMLDGIQDKKGKLDDFYLNFSEWPEMDTYENLFDKTLEYYSALFDEDFFFLNKTRFRQKADFYSLFCLMYEYVKKDLKMKDGVSKYVLEDLKFMNEYIEPESVMQSVFVEYAIKCVSDANSRTSRKFRKDVLHSFIGSAFYREPTNESLSYLLTLIDDQLADATMCSSGEDECPITGKIFTIDQGNIAWKKSDNYFGYSNFHFVSESCRSNAEWLVVNRHDKNIF